ncbi:hypothetical protein BC938DRAFT_473882 [Jimgerdemannia flammicorona]|uniref:Uncharacterized protein n=1 Tax=Jimgerdemannia flammicorona TaxID=994334 RepID=A0A433Q3K8_9FUNG|nr:hypothetical protein BC938DRAFT_473882 [Jimgerdemannia flammicorona]
MKRAREHGSPRRAVSRLRENPRDEQPLDSVQPSKEMCPDEALVSMNKELFNKILGYSTELVEAHREIVAVQRELINSKEATRPSLRLLVAAPASAEHDHGKDEAVAIEAARWQGLRRINVSGTLQPIQLRPRSENWPRY